MDKKIWQNPELCSSLDQSETPFWFWNDELDDKELLKQSEMMSEAGVACNMPHGRGMKWGRFKGGYLDEEWMGHIRTVLDYKKKKKEPVWIYDEMDWPAGTCNQTITLNEKYREQYLSFHRYEIQAGEKFRCQLKELTGKPMHLVKPGGDFTSMAFNVIVRDRETGEKYKPEDYFVYEGMIPGFEFLSDKDAVATVVSIHTDSYENGGRGALCYVDRDATQAFIESTYEKYYEAFPEEFGNTIKAFFNDETRMCNAFPWCSRFEEMFRARKGYSFLQTADSLILPGREAGRVRCDYYDTVAWLFQTEYLGVLKEWCENHNVAFCAHLLGEETTAAQVRFSGDFMRQFKSMTWPGIDHLGKGIGSLNAKYGASAARSYGKKNYQVEMFAGCGWDLTFEEYTRMISWMFQQGVQVIINHAFFYSIRGDRGEDWPPSQFFQWKEWNKMPSGNKMIRRLHYAFSDGIPYVQVLVYQPTESFWMHYIGNELFRHGYSCGPEIKDGRAGEIDRNMQLLMTELQQENLDFDLIHMDALGNYAVDDSGVYSVWKVQSETENIPVIRNCLNGEVYRVFVLPECEMIPLEAIKLAEGFARAGGKVVFLGALPETGMKKEDDAEIRMILSGMQKLENVYQFCMEDVEKYVDCIREHVSAPVRVEKGTGKLRIGCRCYDPFLVDPVVHDGENIEGTGITYYLKDGALLVYLVNYSDKPETLTLDCVSSQVPKLYDPLIGTVGEPKYQKMQNGHFRITVELPCSYGVILQLFSNE